MAAAEGVGVAAPVLRHKALVEQTRRRPFRSTYWWYLIKRIGQAIVVIFIVTVIVFLLLHLAMPDGPAAGILGIQADQSQIDRWNHDHGFDLPLWQQYVNYLVQISHGDFGQSFKISMTVGGLIAQRLPKTLLLAAICMLVALVIALPMGMFQAVKRGRIADYLLTGLNFIIYSTPSFFLGLIVIIVFSQKLNLLPATAPSGNPSVLSLLEQPRVLVLPVITGSLGIIATFSRYMRSATIDNLSEDYVRTARSKGTARGVVITRHVLRNSLTPVIAMLGYYLPVMFGGMLVVEQLFNYPGMGLLFWRSAQQGDFPVLLGCILVIAIATVVGSLVADLLQAALDPRTRGALA